MIITSLSSKIPPINQSTARLPTTKVTHRHRAGSLAVSGQHRGLEAGGGLSQEPLLADCGLNGAAGSLAAERQHRQTC